MAEVDGGQLVVKMLKHEGIQYVFSLPGALEAIYQGCRDNGIRIITTRHEQAAAFMADGWTRVTGKPGVVGVTRGPGVINSLSGVAGATGSSPLVVLGGRNPMTQFDTGATQELDNWAQLDMMKPFTKWAREIYRTERIPEYVSSAFRYACSGRPGPVYLEIPADVLDKKVDEDQVWFPKDYLTKVRPSGDPDAVRTATDLLLSAEKPIIIAGSGVWWAQAGKELQDLVELAQVPLVLRNKARGCVPEDHPLCFGPALASVSHADVIVLVGIRLTWRLGFGRAPVLSEKSKIIQIDIEASQIGMNRDAEVGIVGDAKAVLKQMVEQVRVRGNGQKVSPWPDECREYVKSWRRVLEAGTTSDAVPIHPARLCREVSDFLDRDAIVVADGGEIGVDWVPNLFRVQYQGHFLDHFRLGCLGSAIPFAIAAKLARPQAKVVAIVGDGGFGFSGMEMDTAVRYKIPIVTVVADNGIWGSCKHRQERLYGPDRAVGCDLLRSTRYDKVVEALGGYGELVERPEDIRPALQRAFASAVPACLDVKTDPTVRGIGG